MRQNARRIAILACALTICAEAGHAVELPNIFGSHMVIQRDIKVPVWGSSAPKATVTVEFAGQKKTAVAGEDGKWIVKLDATKANSKPQTMTVTDSANVVKFEDVLVGDNWLCSGQSNMEYSLNGSMNSAQELADVVNYPKLRFYKLAEYQTVDMPLSNAPGRWDTLSHESARELTAVGYFFGRKINKETKIPIGIIESAWGGSRIEWWTYSAGYSIVPQLAGGSSGGMYNGMIAPLVPYAIKGAIWYQGESNGDEGVSYFHKMQALIGGWRKAFGVGDFPFYFVQIANFQNPNPNPEGGDGWARLREAQLKALSIRNTGMAVAIDLADLANPSDIHPKNKQDVGARLAQWALHKTYRKKNIVPSGPLFKDIAIDGCKLVVSFDWVGSGLIVGEKKGLEPVKEIAGGKLNGFAIAGSDKKWAWADAVINGKNVVLSSSHVPNPVAVRYAFSMNPDKANLYNKEGLPASPFRSDDW